MAEHGGLLDRELRAHGIRAAELCDFSVNVGPYGPPPAMIEAIHAARLDTYPDPDGHAARIALAEHVGVTADRIALGNGAAELMWTLVAALRPARVLIVEPTFSELRRAAAARGAAVDAWWARPDRGFAVEPAALDRAVTERRPDLVYVCVPNNPTGASLPMAEVARLVERHPGTRWVIDQAFLRMSEDHAGYHVPLPPNGIRLRSLTKELTIPGVRIGYLIASPQVVAAIERNRPPWTVSSPALAAAEASVHQDAFVDESRRRLLVDRAALETALRAVGLDPFPSRAPFVLVPVPSGASLRTRMLARHRILIRDATSFGLRGAIRLAARPGAELARLIAALQKESEPCGRPS